MRPPAHRRLSRLVVRVAPQFRTDRTFRPAKATASRVQEAKPKYRTQMYQACQRGPETMALPLREVHGDRIAPAGFARTVPNIQIAPAASIAVRAYPTAPGAVDPAMVG